MGCWTMFVCWMVLVVTFAACADHVRTSRSTTSPSSEAQSKAVAKVTKGCNKTIRTTRLIRSPRVTSANRGKPVHCVYRLVKYGVSELLYELNFKAFHVGSHHNGSWCSNGYLQIVDHPSRVNASGYFCGRLQYSRTFLAETDQMALVFHADTYTRQTYFRVQASVLPKRLAQERHKELVMNSPGEPVDGTYCDRSYVNCRGFCDVTSPNYPGFYPRNATCLYRVLFNDTSENSRIVLGGQYYDSFDVWGGPSTRCHSNYCSSKEVTTLCPYDYIKVYDVTASGVAILIQTFCGRGHLPRIASAGPQIMLKFVSAAAGSISNDGFYLSIGPEVQREHTNGILVNGTCQWLFDSKDGQSGHFQNLRHWYPPGTRCSYRFVGQQHQRTFLHFTYFNSNRDECRSKLTLYDSNGPDGSALRGVFCGKKQPNETFQATSESFYVEFDSKMGSYDGSNFEYSVLYMFVDTRTSGTFADGTLCDETFSSASSKQGHFDFFQNRLRLHHRHVTCTFRFEGRRTERIRLIFTRLHFDPTLHCNGHEKRACAITAGHDVTTTTHEPEVFDHLLVIDARKHVMDCLCSNVHLPYEVVSTDSSLEVRLHLHNIPAMAYRDTNAYAFQGTYEFLQVGCGEDYLVGKQGQLAFPNLSPRLLPRNVHCRWTIEVGHDKHVLLKFSHLFLAGNCSTSSLRLYAPWSKDLHRELCLERGAQPEVEPLGWKEGLTTKKTAHKVVLELNASSATRFRLLWTEVGVVSAVSSTSEDGTFDDHCEYRCRGSRFCLTSDLVCNGIINCPTTNASWDPLDESIGDCASVGQLLQWVLATFSTSFVIVLLIAALFLWRKKRCDQAQS